MAINKIITAKASTHSAMKSCIAYVLRDDKTPDKLIGITGPYNYQDITTQNVYDSFISEKQAWNKDSGRMYMHSVISFHKDEYITPQEAYDMGYKLASEDPFYNKFQTLISLHQEKDHTHIHFVTNTVSYFDGHKEHHSANDVKALMERTNKFCLQRGLTVAHKGQHFDGTAIENGNISTYNNNEYRLYEQHKMSWKKDVLDAIYEVVEQSDNKDEFVEGMADRGITTLWKDERKNITFIDATGNKIRAATLAKTFNADFLKTKESLEAKITKSVELNKTLGLKPPSISSGSASESINTAGGIIIKQFKDAKEQEQHNAQHI